MIETTALKRNFGRFHALKGIDLRVEPGDVFGFIGPNGAGKTTTIRILTTLLEPSGGDAKVGGFSVRTDADKVRGLLGYLPDDFGVYRDMTVAEYLSFFAGAYAIPYKARKKLTADLLDLVDLGKKHDAVIAALSRGMQQRLGLARTLVHDPSVLVLDEPASGLDPRARIEMREILKELQRMGKTILLSSHILSELEDVCSRVGILAHGRLVAQGSVPELLAEARGRADVVVATTDDDRALGLLRDAPGVEKIERDEELGAMVARLGPGGDEAALSAHLGASGVWVRRLHRREPSLEQIFLELTAAAEEQALAEEAALKKAEEDRKAARKAPQKPPAPPPGTPPANP